MSLSSTRRAKPTKQEVQEKIGSDGFFVNDTRVIEELDE